jgi:tRNA(Ile)-lysidine synthase
MKSTNPIIKKVRNTIFRYGMIHPGDLIIVAVSGGPDSVCLLHILYDLKDELKFGLVVAHYEHGLRPNEDESETTFVRRLAASMNLPYETDKAVALHKAEIASIEEKARDARYAFLEEVMQRLNAQKIAVGHNLNDQAETVIMRLLRGSSLPGLSGIPPYRDHKIIRPLIQIQRKEILSYLSSRDLSFVLDSSNLETRFLRNEIRLKLMPLLRTYQPRLIEHLGYLAQDLRDEDRYLAQQVEDWVLRNADLKPNGDVIIPVSAFVRLPRPIRSRVTRQILKKIKKNLRRIDRVHIVGVYNMATNPKPQSSLRLPEGFTIKKRYDRLIFSGGLEKASGDFHYLLDGPGTIYIREIARSLSLFELKPEKVLNREESSWISYFDADKLSYPLIVRNFKPGDRFVPLGMTGHKKVKDFFVDLKIPSEMRQSTPLLLTGDTLIWICGYRIDERYKVTPDTKKILKATLD